MSATDITAIKPGPDAWLRPAEGPVAPSYLGTLARAGYQAYCAALSGQRAALTPWEELPDMERAAFVAFVAGAEVARDGLYAPLGEP
jgi:hypothetical protein